MQNESIEARLDRLERALNIERDLIAKLSVAFQAQQSALNEFVKLLGGEPKIIPPSSN